MRNIYNFLKQQNNWRAVPKTVHKRNAIISVTQKVHEMIANGPRLFVCSCFFMPKINSERKLPASNIEGKVCHLNFQRSCKKIKLR